MVHAGRVKVGVTRSRATIDLHLFGQPVCAASFRTLTCMSTHMFYRCVQLSLEGRGGALRHGHARNAPGQGRPMSNASEEVSLFLASFFNLNAQADPTGNLMFLTTMWPVSEVYKQYCKEVAPPHVSPEYFRKIWLRKFPKYRLAKRTKNTFCRCTKCDALGLAYKNAKTLLEQSAFTYFENMLNFVLQLYF